MATIEEITPAIESLLRRTGIELYEIKYVRAGKRSILRVFIDKEAGVTIDDCENASKDISMLLDVENFSNQPYTLEVSSPGLDRPLRRERDYTRVIGQRVRLQVKEADGRQVTVDGTLTACGDGTAMLLINDAVRPIALESVVSGKVEITF
jgi:ribosome maturation factor RimP